MNFVVMPHNFDKRKFAWPTGSEQVYYTSRVDSFPNGTSLSNLPDKVFHKQVRASLDKICDSKKKKWSSFEQLLVKSLLEFLKWKILYSHHAFYATTISVSYFAALYKSCDPITAARIWWTEGKNFWILSLSIQPTATYIGYYTATRLSSEFFWPSPE